MSNEIELKELEKWFARTLVRGSGLNAITEVRQLGVTFSRSLMRISLVSEEGEKLCSLFINASSLGHIGYLKHDMEALKVFLDESNRIEAFAKKVLKDDEFKVFKDEIDHQRKVIGYRYSTIDEPMPDFARLRSIRSEADRVLLAKHSAYYQGTFIDRISALATKPNISTSEQMAIAAFKRMRAAISNQMDEGWSRVFEFCAQHAQQLAQDSPQIRSMEAAIAQQGALSPLLQNQKNQAYARFWTIRGVLAEIYLHHWKPWLLLNSSLEELAEASARKLGKEWRPKAFSGNALINSQKTWDEGILIIKSPGPNDKIPRAVLHTAVQVKVENELSALSQIERDLKREREVGKSSKLPILSILEGRKRQDFMLEVLPPDMAVQRYVFHASAENLRVRGQKLLSNRNLQVQLMPLDIALEEFHALALQILDTAEVYLAKLKP